MEWSCYSTDGNRVVDCSYRIYPPPRRRLRRVGVRAQQDVAGCLEALAYGTAITLKK